LKHAMDGINALRNRLGQGLVIPACPLALTRRRRLDERRQRALLRYYLAAGAGGVAVGVHTTQFAIRDRKVGLFQPVLELAADVLRRTIPTSAVGNPNPAVRIAGVCGRTRQAVAEADLAQRLGYDCALLSLAAMPADSDRSLLAHCRAVAKVIPLFGFYLQPAAGGRVLGHRFWRGLAEIENVVGIKIAPFNRYQTLDVLRAVAEGGRDDIALYTGNDDNIVLDLVTPFRFKVGQKSVERRIVGGLLGHWAVWTKRAVELHEECRRVAQSGSPIDVDLLRRAGEVTDANAAFFDAANQFAGCIPGLHEVLRKQGLLANVQCLDPAERLSPGQRAEIDRVRQAYPHLNDDAFVEEHLDEWLRD
jgi:dihydrodipicolinate synthase/N-acetylneuraminate lyase